MRQLVRQDEAVVRRLAWAFLESTPAILTAPDEAPTRPDWEAVGDAAHHLKSSLDGLGIERLRRVIREAEACGTAPAHAAQQVAPSARRNRTGDSDPRQEFPE